MGSSHQMASAELTAPDLNAAQASYVMPNADGTMEVTIILPDGTTTKGILQTSQVHAAAAPLQITQ